MKKVILPIILIVIICGLLCACAEDKAFLRIHIRANSNDSSDQQVKLIVKKAVVDYLTPLVLPCKNLAEAIEVVGKKKDEICKIATDTLVKNGFNYKASVKVCKENFPIRSYGELTLQAGLYDALIISLGQATGDNWWCVVYPPLCFSGEMEQEKIVYKSLLAELICGK